MRPSQLCCLDAQVERHASDAPFTVLVRHLYGRSALRPGRWLSLEVPYGTRRRRPAAAAAAAAARGRACMRPKLRPCASTVTTCAGPRTVTVTVTVKMPGHCRLAPSASAVTGPTRPGPGGHDIDRIKKFTSKMSKLRRLTVNELPADCFEPVDAKALEQAKAIVEDIKASGEPAFIKWATKLGDVKDGESYVATKDELKAAYDGLSEENRGILTRVVMIYVFNCWPLHRRRY
jgi:hypothetical protein